MAVILSNNITAGNLDSATWQQYVTIFNVIKNEIFSYLVIYVGINAAKEFGATPSLSGFIGGVTLLTGVTSAYKALNRVKNKKIQDHRNWMIRNYSLTFAAVTLRIWLPLFVLLFGLEHFELSYAVIAWLAWMPNLIIAELFIRQSLNKGKQQKNADLHF
ncbi:DUF2306 domain-containing protein [Bacillus mycoides]|uniref:DUF2306 domain-containing protein n=1 Tax=Bacillus mycoides TaxID=1405 RepID=UPI001F47E8C7|nr:DUF2306 domain-containing protein [Bacillus mycoides]